MPKTYDVRINGVDYVYGSKGGLQLGRKARDPGEEVGVAIDTIQIESPHGGPGQYVMRNPNQYWFGSRIDASRPNMLLPAGGITDVHTGDADVFDGIHHATFYEVGSNLYLITPKQVYKIDQNFAVSKPANTTLGGLSAFTGSVARWRGQVILGVEKDPSAAIGGDSSARYAEAAPIIQTISSEAFAALSSPDSWEYVSYITSARGMLWWVQNKGLYGAPEVRWTDKAGTDFGSISSADTYGPFTVPQGGYTTWLHLAGPHILVFKRDGSIVGVDEQQIWITYTPPRASINDDRFGHGLRQYESLMVVPDETGSILFNPGNLSLGSIEPSRVQGYLAYARSEYMARARVFATRGSELYAVGQNKSGSCILYQGGRVGNSFSYSSDYGVYAATTTYQPTAGSPFVVQNEDDSLGSTVRDSGTAHTVRKQTSATTVVESPEAAYVWNHEHGGTYHSHLMIANERTSDGYVKVYRVDLPPVGYEVGPQTFAPLNQLWTSQHRGNGRLAGITKSIAQLRGYVDTTNTGSGSGSHNLAFYANFDGSISISPIGLDVAVSGHFTLQPSATVAQKLGRSIGLIIVGAPGTGWRLEFPLFLDVLTWAGSTSDYDAASLTITLGELDEWAGKKAEATHLAAEALIALRRTFTTIETHWGITWTVFVEDVVVKQVEPDKNDERMPGVYAATLMLRRIA